MVLKLEQRKQQSHYFGTVDETRRDEISTCESCPSGQQYDLYRKASHNFGYDGESGIVYNNDGSASN